MDERITAPVSLFTTAESTQKRLDDLHLGKSGVIESRRIDAVVELSRERFVGPGFFDWPDPDPLPQLVVKNPGFAAEAFITNGNLFYISRYLREKLPFTADEICYLPVDDSLSLAPIRAKQFRILKPRWVEDPADAALSLRPTWEERFPHWANFPESERFDLPYSDIVVRKDFAPRARIFKIFGLSPHMDPYVTPDAAHEVIDLPDIGIFPAPHIRYP